MERAKESLQAIFVEQSLDRLNNSSSMFPVAASTALITPAQAVRIQLVYHIHDDVHF
jgi:hypothetical protein